jgi:phage-related tail protein
MVDEDVTEETETPAPAGYDVGTIATDAGVVARFRVAMASMIYALPDQDQTEELEEMKVWARMVAWNDKTEDDVARVAARLARGSAAFQAAAAAGVPAVEVEAEAYADVLLHLFRVYRGDPRFADLIRPRGS